MEVNLGTKSCSNCGKEKELSAEYWYRRKSSKDGYRGQCKECVRAQKKQYYQENKEKIDRYQEQYRKDNKEYYSEYSKQYRKDNAEEVAKYKKQYMKQYRKDNAEEVAKYKKQYYQSENGRKNRARARQNRRAREAQLPNTLTIEEYEDNLKHFNHSCAYCGYELDKDNHHMEHIVPVSKGGGTTQKNIIPSCESCNSSKHVKTLADWYRFSDDFSIEKLAQIAKHLAQFTDWVVRAE